MFVAYAAASVFCLSVSPSDCLSPTTRNVCVFTFRTVWLDASVSPSNEVKVLHAFQQTCLQFHCKTYSIGRGTVYSMPPSKHQPFSSFLVAAHNGRKLEEAQVSESNSFKRMHHCTCAFFSAIWKNAANIIHKEQLFVLFMPGGKNNYLNEEEHECHIDKGHTLPSLCSLMTQWLNNNP